MVTLDQCGWLGPRVRILPPPHALRGLVEHSSIMDMRSVESDSWLVVPDRCPHLLVQIIEDRTGTPRTRASVVGPRTEAVTFPVKRRRWTIGVRLRPGALLAIGGPPGAELLDRSVSLSGVWGRVGRDAARRIQAELDPQVALGLALDFLVDLADPSNRRGWLGSAFDRALRRSMAGADAGRGVAGIAESLGVSSRTLRRTIARDTGLTPMRHVRIHRLYAAAGRLRDSDRTIGWVAAQTGFSDQAHLARDFVDLMGESPTRFRGRGRQAESFKRSHEIGADLL